MTRNVLIIFSIIAAILFLPIALRKNAAVLGSAGGKRVLASRPIAPMVKRGEVYVYLGDKKVFGLGEDLFDGPLFIYPFSDNQRYLCIYNWDTAILVFLVDLDASHTNLTVNWPEKVSLRQCFADAATNLVLNSNSIVRLATDDELEQVRDYLSRASETKIKAASLPYCDLGFWRSYEDREILLLDLATNRQNYWPMPGAP